MEDVAKFKMIIVLGLVVVGLVVGYVIFTQRFASTQSLPNRPVQQIDQVTPSPTPETLGQQAPAATKTLPKTGFPIGLLGIFATSAAISGYFLRQFPR
ncbi:hypothetical protein HY386_00540 [Candidatus Daviesbacteria bacterium]|nr:hypothetical protein [Candidatus Daviesbacteria bacterium]